MMRTLLGARAKTSATTALVVAAFAFACTMVPWAAPRAQVAAPDESVMLNFPNSDLETVVRAVGQFTGRMFVIDPRVKGTLNLITERPVNKQQAYEQLLAALRLSGFTIVESGQPGGIARILPEADAKLQGGRVVEPESTAPRGDQIVTQVFRMQYESATSMVPVLRPLIAPNNTISAVPANNSLVITDYADNLRRIARIIEALDSPVSSATEMMTLKHGLAVEIATIATRVLDEGARAAGQAIDGGQRVQVLAEPRTNSLIIRAASPARAKLARQLIERLDQPSVTPGNINVVYLRNAEATKLAPLLRAVLVSDPSFVPATSGSGLSTGTAAPGAPTFGAPGQPGAAPAQPAQATAGGGASSGGAAGSLGGMIQPDAATNSLIITAPEPLYRNIRTIIEKLDARRAQVVIESLIAEVTADKAAEFGIQWQDLSGLNSTNTRVVGGTNFNSSAGGSNIVGAAANLSTLGPGLNIGVVRGKVTIPGIGEVINLGFLARALETTANANILSQPNIQTLDNEEAKFLVGQNVPFITGSYTNTGTTSTGAVNPFQTFERKDIGLQLRVKPQISEGGTIKLAIYLENSSIAPGTSAGGLILQKRAFESNLLVEDGDFVVLSGLIEDSSNSSQSKVPLLGDLPLVGGLFRYENRERKKTNTMVFLRPTIIRNAETSTALATDRYDYMRTKIINSQQPDSPVFRDFNVEPGAAVPARTVPNPPAGVPAPQGAAPAAPTAPAAASAPVTGAFAASASSPPGARVQLIQIAAVGDVARGRQLQRELRDAGYDAYWESVRTDRGEVVRVRIAVDRTRQDVDEVVARLKSRGHEPILVAP